MLSLSAMAGALVLIAALMLLGPRSGFVARAEIFNKVATAVVLCVAALWFLIKDEDADRLNLKQDLTFERVSGSDRMNVVSAVTIENDGDVPVQLPRRAFALFIDQFTPTGNRKVQGISAKPSLFDEPVIPAVRIRGSYTVAMLLSEGHRYYHDPEYDRLIGQTSFDTGQKALFYDNRHDLDDEVQPKGTAVLVFWSMLSCKDPGLNVSRFELEIEPPWYRWLYLAIRRGFRSPEPTYSKQKIVFDMADKCKEKQNA